MKYELTGLQKVYLDTVRERMTDEDRAPELVTAVDEDGMIYLEPAPLKDQLAYFVAKWIWDESVAQRPAWDTEV
jgi:hypothetical protein